MGASSSCVGVRQQYGCFDTHTFIQLSTYAQVIKRSAVSDVRVTSCFDDFDQQKRVDRKTSFNFEFGKINVKNTYNPSLHFALNGHHPKSTLWRFDKSPPM